LRPNSRTVAFGATGKGEARTALLGGTEVDATGSTSSAFGAGVQHRPRLIQRTAGYGPVCPVVWEGRHREMPPIPIASTSMKMETGTAEAVRAFALNSPPFLCPRHGSA
jgi:hypothetical protein